METCKNRSTASSAVVHSYTPVNVASGGGEQRKQGKKSTLGLFFDQSYFLEDVKFNILETT